jgi:hypothetical protein
MLIPGIGLPDFVESALGWFRLVLPVLAAAAGLPGRHTQIEANALQGKQRINYF